MIKMSYKCKFCGESSETANRLEFQRGRQLLRIYFCDECREKMEYQKIYYCRNCQKFWLEVRINKNEFAEVYQCKKCRKEG